MEHGSDPQQLSEAILTAPAWAQAGLAEPDVRTREKAASELANTIVERLSDYLAITDPAQLRLL